MVYYKVSERVLSDGSTKYIVAECEGDMPRTSAARTENGVSVIDRCFKNKTNAEKYAAAYNAASKGDIDTLLAEVLKGLENRTGKSKLKMVRETRELSQSQLAKKTGISISLIQFYEQRVKQITKIDKILRLCIALNCKMSDIIEDEETIILLKKYEELL